MAHLITPSPTSRSPISRRATHKTSPPLLFQRNCATHPAFNQALHDKTVTRRVFVWGLTGAALCLNAGQQSASAAKRRPPPPPPSEERKDPNLSGIQAKVLASKKRKEAMEESVAKLRERGKPIDQQPPE